ncbi:uncharacterized protein LOC118146156 [Callithrix jacchus]|uniref:uncharacterized protein LOC118146156 n=1 Tax=Callithrix jacchus TaxID=9483 RepID=UPI0023DD00A3|nr:uncharacterized protein LOC118146156 [Callithrix jacchus]
MAGLTRDTQDQHIPVQPRGCRWEKGWQERGAGSHLPSAAACAASTDHVVLDELSVSSARKSVVYLPLAVCVAQRGDLHLLQAEEDGEIGVDDDPADIQQLPAPIEIHVPGVDPVGGRVSVLPGEDRTGLLRGPGLGRPHCHPPLTGVPTQDSPEDAVGGGQHPLGVDEGAPADVHPGCPLVAVDPQADLPRPLPLGGVVAPNDAQQVILRDSRWERQEEVREPGLRHPSLSPCPHSGQSRTVHTSPGSWVRAGGASGKGGL